MRSKKFNLLEDELHAEPELLVGVDLEVVELVDEDVELLRTKFVQDAASLARQNLDRVLSRKNKSSYSTKLTRSQCTNGAPLAVDDIAGPGYSQLRFS